MATVLIILRAWYTIPLDHVRLAVTVETITHFMAREHRPALDK